ncbi:MAG: hypothetical protein EBS71_09655, partial [Actinobacteria bacterium]|nr:hypothetical protein [Actinomycetota bacterium]
RGVLCTFGGNSGLPALAVGFNFIGAPFGADFLAVAMKVPPSTLFGRLDFSLDPLRVAVRRPFGQSTGGAVAMFRILNLDRACAAVG